MFVNGASDLALFAMEIAEHQAQLERARVEVRRLFELVDRQIHLTGDQVVETEDEVGRLADAAAIDPASFDELVALPRFAGRQTDEERDQDGDEEAGVLHRYLRCFFTWRSHWSRARSTSSTSSRTAPRPPPYRLTQCTRESTSSLASAGAADKADTSENRQVQQVVAHVCNLIVGQRSVLQQLRVRRTFVRPGLDDELNPQFSGAMCRRERRAPAQQAHVQPLLLRPDERRPIADRERLGFPAVVPNDDRPVGQNAIDIQQQELDLARPVLSDIQR